MDPRPLYENLREALSVGLRDCDTTVGSLGRTLRWDRKFCKFNLHFCYPSLYIFRNAAMDVVLSFDQEDHKFLPHLP